MLHIIPGPLLKKGHFCERSVHLVDPRDVDPMKAAGVEVVINQLDFVRGCWMLNQPMKSLELDKILRHDIGEVPFNYWSFRGIISRWSPVPA